MIHATTDLREGPTSRVEYSYWRTGRRNGRIVHQERVAMTGRRYSLAGTFDLICFMVDMMRRHAGWRL